MTFYSHIQLQPSMYSTLLIFFFVTSSFFFFFIISYSFKKYKLRNMINYVAVAGMAVKGKVVYIYGIRKRTIIKICSGIYLISCI